MYCALCKRQIIDGKFTDPKNHRKGCPIFIDTESVAKVIVREITQPQGFHNKTTK